MSATLKYTTKDFSKPRDFDKLQNSYTKRTFDQPKPKDEEILPDPKKYLLSKTDAYGNIEYCNSYFTRISGYREEELIGKPHSIVRHPDMPGALYALLWENLHRRKSIYIVVKNLAKDGRYYWIATDFNIRVNKAIDELEGFFAYQRAAPRHAIEKLEPFYQRLRRIEDESGLEASYKYLTNYLEDRGESYDAFIDDIVNTSFRKKIAKLKQRLFATEEEVSLIS